MPAAPIHLGWLPPSRAMRALQALGRLLRDSERTDEVVVGEEITAQAQLSYWVRNGIFERGEGADLLRDQPELAKLDLGELRSLPDQSLGREFARFLDDQGIDLSALAQPTPYTSGPEESYLMRRIRQSHDLWHVLIGVGTRGHEEVLVHCFSIAQTGFPYSCVIIFFGALKHMVLERRWGALGDARRAYRAGKNSASLLGTYWERRWREPLEGVRAEFQIQPLAEANATT